MTEKMLPSSVKFKAFCNFVTKRKAFLGEANGTREANGVVPVVMLSTVVWGIAFAVFLAEGVIVRYLSLICFSMLWVIPSGASGPPSIAELMDAHAKLRAASASVQGEFKVYRLESVVLAALEDSDSNHDIPLDRSGKLWRNKDRFRANYTSYRRSSETVSEITQSVAIDDGKVYEFSDVGGESGALRIYGEGTSHAATARRSKELRFLEPLDSLWRKDGTPIVDLLQRPDVELIPGTETLPTGFSLLVSPENSSNTQLRFELMATSPYALGYGLMTHQEAGVDVKAELRVFSSEKEGVVLPDRIATVVSVGGTGGTGGYTEIVTMDLIPLQDDSPIHKPIVSDSFKDMGTGYQVYRIDDESGEGVLAERYEELTPLDTDERRAPWSRLFLLLNGCIIMTIFATLIYKNRKKRNSK